MAEQSAQRVRGLACIFLVTFFVLVARMAFVQLVIGDDLAERCRDQRAVSLATVPARGAVYDRNMRVLAGEFHRCAIVVFPEFVKAREAVARMVARLTGGSWEDVLSRLGSPAPLYVAARAVPSLAGRIDTEALGEALRDPGVAVVEQPARYHPDAIGAHVIGYLDPSGGRGASGVERLLDDYLREGEPGEVAVFADARGVPLRGLGVRWLPGKAALASVRLTIDREIQSVVEDVMNDAVERGAVVVMDPRSGDVLAMASRPAFRPDDIAAAARDPASSLVNRAIMAYPPGSVFKVVVAAAAIESGAVSLQDTFHDPGYVDVGAARFRCYTHEEGGHGEITFIDAMAYSCNTAFIDAGLRTGAGRLVGLAESMGLGATTGVALPGEQAGVLPDARSMSPQDVANLAIGQGRLTVTPLQVATVMSAVANGGLLRRPRVVMEILSDDPARARRIEPAAPVRVLSEDTCRQVTFMLEAVTRWGTGTAAWLDEGGSCGKTGSAETGKVSEAGSPVSHAWFAGFAPLSDPRLVIVVFVEEGMSGGRAAAPVFARIARRALQVYPASR
ncbi:MAG: penicillin-binding transpeptidase domain-containing protein [Bacillota bacterium]|nr:penicillin-binding transpeptidase domain-containing protein [Bacillota bacterium]